VFGGKANGYCNDLHSYHIENEQWSPIAAKPKNTPPSSYGHSAIAYQDIMYVFGGYDNNGFCSNELYRFDFNTKQWLDSKRLNMIPERFYHAVSLEENGKMFISGGCNSSRMVFDDVYQIDLTNDQFTSTALTSMPNTRYGHVMFFSDQTLHVYGGCSYNATEDYDSGFTLPLETQEWEPSSLKPFREGSVFATVSVDHNFGELFYGGIHRNQIKKLETVKMSNQATTKQQYLIELTEQLGDAALVILQFLSLNDIISMSMVSKHWQMSILANRKCISYVIYNL
jgi:N-acetylneuraminic acid mutarotase